MMDYNLIDVKEMLGTSYILIQNCYDTLKNEYGLSPTNELINDLYDAKGNVDRVYAEIDARVRAGEE